MHASRSSSGGGDPSPGRLMSSIEAASSRLADSRQRYFDAVSTMSIGADQQRQHNYPHQLSSAGEQQQQQHRSVSFKLPGAAPDDQHSSTAAAWRIPADSAASLPPELPPPPACENCLVLSAAVGQLEEGMQGLEVTYQRKVDALNDTVTFVEAERQETARKFDEVLLELQVARQHLLEKDGLILEERGRVARLEMMLDSEARRAGRVVASSAAGNAHATLRELSHLALLEQSERSALFNAFLMRLEVIEVSHQWGLDAINARAAADARDEIVARMTPSRRPPPSDAVDGGTAMTAPDARTTAAGGGEQLFADASVSPAPELVPPRRMTFAEENATIRTLRAEIDALTADRDTLVDQLASARVESNRFGRQLTVLRDEAKYLRSQQQQQQQQQQPDQAVNEASFTSATPGMREATPSPQMEIPRSPPTEGVPPGAPGGPVVVTSPTAAAPAAASDESHMYELVLTEMRARNRHTNFQTREYYAILHGLMSRIMHTMAKEKKALEAAVERAQSRAAEEARMTDAANARAEAAVAELLTKVQGLEKDVAVSRAEAEALRTLNNSSSGGGGAGPSASALSGFQPPAAMRECAPDTNDKEVQTVNFDEDAEQEISALRVMMMESKQEAATARAQLEQSRSKLTALEQLLQDQQDASARANIEDRVAEKRAKLARDRQKKQQQEGDLAAQGELSLNSDLGAPPNLPPALPESAPVDPDAALPADQLSTVSGDDDATPSAGSSYTGRPPGEGGLATRGPSSAGLSRKETAKMPAHGGEQGRLPHDTPTPPPRDPGEGLMSLPPPPPPHLSNATLPPPELSHSGERDPFAAAFSASSDLGLPPPVPPMPAAAPPAVSLDDLRTALDGTAAVVTERVAATTGEVQKQLSESDAASEARHLALLERLDEERQLRMSTEGKMAAELAAMKLVVRNLLSSHNQHQKVIAREVVSVHKATEQLSTTVSDMQVMAGSAGSLNMSRASVLSIADPNDAAASQQQQTSPPPPPPPPPLDQSASGAGAAPAASTPLPAAAAGGGGGGMAQFQQMPTTGGQQQQQLAPPPPPPPPEEGQSASTTPPPQPTSLAASGAGAAARSTHDWDESSDDSSDDIPVVTRNTAAPTGDPAVATAAAAPAGGGAAAAEGPRSTSPHQLSAVKKPGQLLSDAAAAALRPPPKKGRK